MTEKEKLEHDITTLRESIRLNGQDLAKLKLTPEERTGIIKNSALCMKELIELKERLGLLPAN